MRQHEDVPNELKQAAAAPGRHRAKRHGKKPEREGVFVVQNGVAMFRPVKVGIAGEEHFEVVDGLQAGDTVVAGPVPGDPRHEGQHQGQAAVGEDRGRREEGVMTMTDLVIQIRDLRRELRHGQRDRSTPSAAWTSTSPATSTWRSWGRRARASPP